MGAAPVEEQPFPATAGECWFLSVLIGIAFAAVIATATAVAFDGDWRVASAVFAAGTVAAAFGIRRWLAETDGVAPPVGLRPESSLQPEETAPRTCRHCGASFASRRPNQVYCEAACREAASRQRRRARELRGRVHLLNEARSRPGLSRR